MQSYRVLETCSPYLVGSIYVALELLLLYIVCGNLRRVSKDKCVTKMLLKILVSAVRFRPEPQKKP
ncbi:uncharacterized protein METZ01_LOCUS278186, partial [marine metagenome]